MTDLPILSTLPTQLPYIVGALLVAIAFAAGYIARALLERATGHPCAHCDWVDTSVQLGADDHAPSTGGCQVTPQGGGGWGPPRSSK